ncbi:MAG: MFS transporter [Candidatus Puniceispirillum sp.]|nr:MFS transporter [Candidatus Puniceispirillum sp.]
MSGASHFLLSHIFTSFLSYLRPYKDARVLVVWGIGFFCGLPLLLTASTLSLWLHESGLALTTIGLLGAVKLPYTMKFAWSPLVDRMHIPFLTRALGRRKAWLVAAQTLLSLCLFSMGQLDPGKDLALLALCALGVSFSASTSVIVMFAYQAERLGRTQFGAGEAMGIFGYRMGILLAGAGVLYLVAHYVTWGEAYMLMGAISGLGMIYFTVIKEPDFRPCAHTQEWERSHTGRFSSPLMAWSYGAFVCPFQDFMKRHKMWVICLLIMLLYKMGDDIIGNMGNIFYTEVGFSKTEIAQASKVFGMIASILGGFVGGIMTARLGMLRTLLWAGLLHAVSLLCFLWVGAAGHDMGVLYICVALEHLTGGMRVTALFAYQLTLCNPTYAATQLALLSSLVELGRVVGACASGLLVETFGWQMFFVIAFFVSLPALFLVKFMGRWKHYVKNVPSQEPSYVLD